MKLIIFFIVGLLPGIIFANPLDLLNAKLKLIQQDKAHLAVAIEKGRQRTVLCAFCHGADGISSRSYIPDLAAQHPAYLLQQFAYFTSGIRKSDVMQPLSRELSKDDRINIALYYSNMSGKTSTPDDHLFDQELAREGKPLYLKLCVQCHGAHGEGRKEFPRLAGQKVDYVRNTLALFAAPKSDENDALLFDAQRSNPMMVSIVKKLRPAQIRALANYVASLY